MSLVTTPMRTSLASSRQSAAMRLLLPEPTGPPTPTRSARSADKEPLRAGGVAGGCELEAGRRGGWLCGDGALVGGGGAGGRLDCGGGAGGPARRPCGGGG